ncbi:MAG: TIGR03620 family F420-dependent LLM class oxidoreductase [SAR324 cluster bacterium]|nr:TIGR03620 family F420-dependent LLM class oxidoreductase [SAR324 cluster bacterium]
MELGKLGVWCSTDAFNAKDLAELARRIEGLGYAALWYPEARGHESFATGSFLLSQTSSLIVATGIANIYARDATTAKLGQQTLAKLSGGRFLLGLGVSHIPMVEGLRGHSYGKPVATMRAYLEAMENTPGLNPPLEQAPPTVLAALGPKMTELGATRTAGVHPYLVTPEHTARTRKIAGPEAWVCVEQKVLLSEDAAQAREAARQAVSFYMTLPNYRNNWLSLGFGEEELAEGGSERFLDAMVAWGNLDAIKERIQQHFDAGASHVCIQTVRADGQRLPDMELLEALAP